MRAAHDKETRRRVAELARRCVDWCRVQGFEVLVVRGGSFQSRVVIKPSALCSLLDGVAQGFERTWRGERRYCFVVRFGCVVEWEAA